VEERVLARGDGVPRRAGAPTSGVLPAPAAPEDAPPPLATAPRSPVADAGRLDRLERLDRAVRAPAVSAPTPALLASRVASAIDRPKREAAAQRRREADAAERLRRRAARAAGDPAATRLSRLADKLVGLVHLVEAERRDDEARRRVRRASEPAPAAAPSAAACARHDDGVAIEALRRDVLVAVRAELEDARSRRDGDPHADVGW
jgi:hypothetical protein